MRCSSRATAISSRGGDDGHDLRLIIGGELLCHTIEGGSKLRASLTGHRTEQTAAHLRQDFIVDRRRQLDNPLLHTAGVGNEDEQHPCVG